MRIGNRLGNLVSQALNSIGSLMWVSLVARNAPIESFGFWALLYAFATTLLQISRTAWGTVLLVSPGGRELEEAENGSAGLSLVASVVFGLAFPLLALTVAPGELFTALAFAALLPIWLLHDAVRLVCMRHGRGVTNALLDAAWVVPLLLFAMILEHLDAAGAISMTLARIAAATVGLVFALLAWRRVPSLRRAYQFTRENTRQLKTLTLDAGLASATGTLLPLALAASLGLTATAALRGANTLLGGVALLVMALTPMATVRMARLSRLGDDGKQFLTQWSLALGITAGLYGAVILALPESLGRSLLGSSWEAARAIALPLVLQAIIRGPQTGVPILLRAQSRIDEGLRIRVSTSLVNLVVPMVGALVWGLPGAAWGILLAAIVNNVQYLTKISFTKDD